MPDLPRSARWVCWFNAWRAGTTALETALDAVRGDDAAHHVLVDRADHGTGASALSLVETWGALRREGAPGAVLALPAPGDPYGLSGPAATNAAATDAQEAVVVEGVGTAFVPEVVGAGVFWHRLPSNPPRHHTSVPEAARELRTALARSAEGLLDLDVARWQPDVREALADVRGPSDVLLAPGYEPRAEQLAATALRCLAIVDLAADHESAAVTTWEVEARDAHLRSLSGVARHALVAACSAGRPH